MGILRGLKKFGRGRKSKLSKSPKRSKTKTGKSKTNKKGKKGKEGKEGVISKGRKQGRFKGFFDKASGADKNYWELKFDLDQMERIERIYDWGKDIHKLQKKLIHKYKGKNVFKSKWGSSISNASASYDISFTQQVLQSQASQSSINIDNIVFTNFVFDSDSVSEKDKAKKLAEKNYKTAVDISRSMRKIAKADEKQKRLNLKTQDKLIKTLQKIAKNANSKGAKGMGTQGLLGDEFARKFPKLGDGNFGPLYQAHKKLMQFEKYKRFLLGGPIIDAIDEVGENCGCDGDGDDIFIDGSGNDRKNKKGKKGKGNKKTKKNKSKSKKAKPAKSTGSKQKTKKTKSKAQKRIDKKAQKARKRKINKHLEKEIKKAQKQAQKKAQKKIQKQILKKAAKNLSKKEMAKIAAKGTAKGLSKKIPIVGIAMGLGFGAARAWEGDWLGAGGEVISGILGGLWLGGAGTAGSIGMDAWLIKHEYDYDTGANEDKKTDKDKVAEIKKVDYRLTKLWELAQSNQGKGRGIYGGLTESLAAERVRLMRKYHSLTGKDWRIPIEKEEKTKAKITKETSSSVKLTQAKLPGYKGDKPGTTDTPSSTIATPAASSGDQYGKAGTWNGGSLAGYEFDGGEGIAKATKVNGKRAVQYPNGMVKIGGHRSWRNNNPGNLVCTKSTVKKYGACGCDAPGDGYSKSWRGLIFCSWKKGMAAQRKLLKTKYKNMDFVELARIYQKGQNPSKYANTIAKFSGLDPHRKIGSLSEEELDRFVYGQMRAEGMKKGIIKNAKGEIVKDTNNFEGGKKKEKSDKDTKVEKEEKGTDLAKAEKSSGSSSSTNENTGSVEKSSGSTGTVEGISAEGTKSQLSVKYAQSMANKGIKYIWGAGRDKNSQMNGASSYDCSSFVAHVVYKTYGIPISKFGGTVAIQWKNMNAGMGVKVPLSQAQPGDILYMYGGSTPSHVGIYIGDGKMVHASGGRKRQGWVPGKTGVITARIPKPSSIKGIFRLKESGAKGKLDTQTFSVDSSGTSIGGSNGTVAAGNSAATPVIFSQETLNQAMQQLQQGLAEVNQGLNNISMNTPQPSVNADFFGSIPF